MRSVPPPPSFCRHSRFPTLAPHSALTHPLLAPHSSSFISNLPLICSSLAPHSMFIFIYVFIFIRICTSISTFIFVFRFVLILILMARLPSAVFASQKEEIGGGAKAEGVNQKRGMGGNEDDPKAQRSLASNPSSSICPRASASLTSSSVAPHLEGHVCNERVFISNLLFPMPAPL